MMLLDVEKEEVIRREGQLSPLAALLYACCRHLSNYPRESCLKKEEADICSSTSTHLGLDSINVARIFTKIIQDPE